MTSLLRQNLTLGLKHWVSNIVIVKQMVFDVMSCTGSGGPPGALSVFQVTRYNPNDPNAPNASNASNASDASDGSDDPGMQHCSIVRLNELMTEIVAPHRKLVLTIGHTYEVQVSLPSIKAELYSKIPKNAPKKTTTLYIAS